MSPPTKGEIKNGQSRETDNKWYTGHEKQKHNTICVGHHYTQTNTNNVNKTWALLLKGKLKMDNPEKLTTNGTQDMKNKNTTQYVLDTTIRKQTQIM